MLSFPAGHPAPHVRVHALHRRLPDGAAQSVLVLLTRCDSGVADPDTGRVRRGAEQSSRPELRQVSETHQLLTGS